MVRQVSPGNDLVAPGSVCPLGTPRTAGTLPRLVFPGRTHCSQDCPPPGLRGHQVDEDDRPQCRGVSLENWQLPDLATASSHLSHGTAPTGRYRYQTLPSIDRRNRRVYARLCPPIHPQGSHYACSSRLYSCSGNTFRRNNHRSALRTGLLAMGPEGGRPSLADGYAGA